MVRPRVSPVLAAEERPRLADLALAVRARREDLGLRQAELADLAGVAARTVHAIEAAKPTVQLDKLLDVLAALGLHLELARGARGDVAADARRADPAVTAGPDQEREDSADLERLKDVERAVVLKKGRPAATLTRTEAGIEFAYDEAWLDEGKQPVATTLPLTADPVRTPGGSLPAYFAGLLPEGRRLGALRRAVKTSADDELSLLLAVGADAIGDVAVVPEGDAWAATAPALEVDDFAEVSFAEILAGLRRSASTGSACRGCRTRSARPCSTCRCASATNGSCSSWTRRSSPTWSPTRRSSWPPPAPPACPPSTLAWSRTARDARGCWSRGSTAPARIPPTGSPSRTAASGWACRPPTSTAPAPIARWPPSSRCARRPRWPPARCSCSWHSPT